MRRIVLTALLGIVLPASAAVVLAGDEKKAASDAERAAIERLVQQLGADDFRTREEASRKLAGYGTKARDVLREAARTSQSPEVRWRAEQLLRRMDGAGERPLGAGPGTAPEGEAPASGELDSLMEQVRKQMEAFLQRKPRGGLLDSLMEGDKIEAPGLVLERSFARGSKLLVKRKTEAGEEVTDTFTGLGLADILRRHPELAKHPGMAELQRKVAERAWPGLEEFHKHFKDWPRMRVETFPRGGGFSMATSQGVSIKQDADGVTVTIRERGEDGKEKTIELKGKTLEEIKKKHPEHADKLGNFGFSFRVSPPNFFWPGQKTRRLDPLRPVTPSPRQVEGKVVFGLQLDDVSDVLASHLGLTSGAGALVHNVVPGTQAEEIGLRRNDVLVKINGQAVTKQSAAALLRKAGAQRSALTIELIRRGKPLTLTRP